MSRVVRIIFAIWRARVREGTFCILYFVIENGMPSFTDKRRLYCRFCDVEFLRNRFQLTRENRAFLPDNLFHFLKRIT